jgi:hypothetical protein
MGRRASCTYYRLPSPATGKASHSGFRFVTFGPVHVRVHGVDSPIWSVPYPLNVTDNGLSAAADVDVFDCDFLLSLAATTVQCHQQCRVCAGQLVCLI